MKETLELAMQRPFSDKLLFISSLLFSSIQLWATTKPNSTLLKLCEMNRTEVLNLLIKINVIIDSIIIIITDHVRAHLFANLHCKVNKMLIT